MYLIYSLTAWGCQGAHNGLCDSLGWQGGDFAFSASFLILNEIMRPGGGGGGGHTTVPWYTIYWYKAVTVHRSPFSFCITISRFPDGGCSAEGESCEIAEENILAILPDIVTVDECRLLCQDTRAVNGTL